MTDTRKPDGGPAFPVTAENGLGHISDGMNLRDWFAGQALVGLMANPQWGGLIANSLNRFEVSAAMTTSGFAYQLADAMIAERSK